MKSIIVIVSSFVCALPSIARSLPPLPEPAFADTEVTAHHPLDLPQSNVNGLNLEIAFSGTPSNNVWLYEASWNLMRLPPRRRGFW